jgi:putative endonuclease
MATHNELGKLGEELAQEYLLKNGYTILYRNWRHSRYEIDVVALKNNLPHFVEVKTRSSNEFGDPEDSVSKKKIRFLLQAADAFLYKHPTYTDFRVDILSINIQEKEKPQFFFIEDVYL